MSTLQPVQIQDKNGKHTTVHKKVATVTSANARPLPSPNSGFSSLTYSAPSSSKKVKPLTVSDEQVREVVEFLAENAADISFANRSYDSKNNLGLSELTLADMADGRVANNNCESASNAVVAFASENNSFFGGSAFPVMIETDDGIAEHWAVEFEGIDGESLILDLTARQYDNELQFPWIGTSDEWLKMTQRHAELGRWRG